MIGLQEMLLQTDGDRLYIFPSWPLDRDISFRLHAPGNTVVEATLSGGKLTDLTVIPSGRAADIVLPAKLQQK